MKKNRIFYIAGILLICLSILLIQQHKKTVARMQSDTLQITEKLQQHLPLRQPAVAFQYSIKEMPACDIDGIDYCALLDIPPLGIELPVANSWNNAETTPARYSGSVYDNTMIIGGSTHHFSFATQLDIGYKITVVDMLGGEYNYTVARIDRANSIGEDKLVSDYPLTLFSYIPKEKKYVVIRCE